MKFYWATGDIFCTLRLTHGTNAQGRSGSGLGLKVTTFPLRSYLADQLLVWECISRYQLSERIAEQVIIPAIVESPFHFIEVGRKVLNRQLVIGTNDRPLEQAPRRFNGVRVNVTPYPFLDSVIHGIVSLEREVVIGAVAVCVDRGRWVNVRFDKSLSGVLVDAPVANPETDTTIAGDRPDNHRLVCEGIEPFGDCV